MRLVLLAGFWAPLAICTYLALSPATGTGRRRPTNHVLAFSYLTPALWLAHGQHQWTAPAMLLYGTASRCSRS